MKVRFLAASLALFGCCGAGATTIVDWGGNYVSETQVYSNAAFPENFRSETVSGQGYNTLRGPILFYDGTVANLTPGSGYTAPTGKSSTFYGGWSSSSGSDPAVPGGTSGTDSGLSSRSVFQNSGLQPGEDFIYLASNASAPAFRGLILFDKDDFLNGAASQTVTFDNTSSISFNGLVGGARPVLRWVIQDGNTTYISEATFTGTGSFLFWGAAVSSSLADPNSQNWAPYIPIESDSAGPYLYNPAPASGYATHAFSDVQTIGVYFDSYGIPITDGTFTNVGLQQFTVDALVIPEPGVTALLAVAGFSVLLGMRRNGTKSMASAA